MANTKISALTADAAPTADDLVVTVNDPGGTPATRKATITNFTKAIPAVVGDSGSGGTKGLVPAPGAGDAAANKFLHADGTFKTPTGSGSIGGSTGSTDNALLRADGTGGSTVQASAITVDDNGAITVPEIAAPGTPASGKVVVYAKSDGLVYGKDDAGTETKLSNDAGGGTPGGASGDIQYNNAGAFGNAPLVREDADTVGLYDTSNAGENPSRLNIYGLKNGATFERMSLYYNTADDRYVLDINHNGGTTRDLQIRMNGTPFWQIEDTGEITAASNTASVMRVGSGTSSAPGLQFSTSPTGNNNGFTFSSGPFVNTITNGAKRLAVHDFGAMLGSGGRLGWASTSLESGTTEDVALSRDAAGRALVEDGSVSHNPRDLRLRASLHHADTFANRPGTPVKGMIICVTDSTVNTFGATVAGGGGNSVLAWYNGTDWTVIGV